MNDKFNTGLYQDVGDVWGKNNSQRQFYTMPNTRPYSDQGSFANWLYNTPVSCAQGTEVALKQVRACSYNNKRLDEVELI